MIPNFKKNIFNTKKKMTSIRKIERKDDDDLLHGEDAGMIYKYDLPVLN